MERETNYSNAARLHAVLNTARRFDQPTSSQPRSMQFGDTTVVDQWDGQKWVSRKLTWNGEAFVPEVK